MLGAMGFLQLLVLCAVVVLGVAVAVWCIGHLDIRMPSLSVI